MIEDLFPQLAESGYSRTSDQTRDYNCIAWAAGDDQRWWDWLPGYYWPQDATRTCAVKGLIEAFAALGYEHCAERTPEEGYEKVALYAVGGTWSHAARQLPSGAWTSKLGGLEDIEHATLDGLCGTEYGSVVYVMRRKT